MKCCAINCNNVMNFRFPKNVDQRKKWIRAIKKPGFSPKSKHGLCMDHFNPKDIVRRSYLTGYRKQRTVLKRGAVPLESLCEGESIVDIDLTSQIAESAKESTAKIPTVPNTNNLDNRIAADNIFNRNTNADKFDGQNVSYKRCDKSTENSTVDVYRINFENAPSTQTQKICKISYNIDNLKNSPKVLLHFTGLQDYEKFMSVYYSLASGLYHLKPINVVNFNTRNQLFLVLWKLRQYPSDIELAYHFNISETIVSTIFVTWILFMAKTWSTIDQWPIPTLIDFYTPLHFKKDAKLHDAVHITKDSNELGDEYKKHGEKMIMLLKTFNILSKKLSPHHLPIASKIVGVCMILSNFKEIT